MRLARFALQNPHWVLVCALGVLIVGYLSIFPTPLNFQLPKDILPLFRVPAVQVLTLYPGMPAEVMERDITTRMQRWTGQSVGIEHQEARSMIGVSIVRNFFREDIDFNSALSQVTSLAMSDLYYLPPGTVPPMVMPFDPTASIPLVLLTVSHPTFNEKELYDVAYYSLRNMLQGISGVVAPAVFGGTLRRIYAYVDPEKLAARNLSPMDVVRALAEANVLIPTGNAKLGDKDVQIVTNAQVESVDEMNEFMIRAQQGVPVAIKDVAVVKDTNEIQTNVVRVDGKRQVYVPIYRQPGANTIEVVKGIKRELSKVLDRLPEGIAFKLVADQSIFVRQAINSLSLEVVMGSVLAGVMVFIFLGNFKATFAALLAIPLSIFACAIGLRVTGETLNTMTLGGIALSVGILIDTSIVVLENISRHLNLRRKGENAALEGASEVAAPVLAATTTIAIVFLPVVFLSGIGKFLFTPLAKSVVFAIVAAYFVSMTLVPLYCNRFLTGTKMQHRDPRWYTSLLRLYDGLLGVVLRRRVLVVLAAVALFMLSLGLYPKLGKELFPRADVGHISMIARLPTGLRIELTEDVIADIEKAIRNLIEPKALGTIISNIGVLYDWPAAYTPNSGPSDAFIEIELTDDRSATAEEYAAKLRDRLATAFPHVEFAFATGGLLTAALNMGQPAPINIQVKGKGNEFKIMGGLAQQVKELASTVEGAVDVRIQERLNYPQIKLTIKRKKAARLGLTTEEIVQNIVTSFNSSVNFFKNFWIAPNGNHYFLGAQYPEDLIKDLDTLRNIPITGRNLPHVVRLHEIVDISEATAPSEVRHVNIRRTMNVFANTYQRDVGSVAADIEEKIKTIVVPPGFEILISGETAAMRESFEKLGWGLLISVVLVYLVLAGQFRSFTDPLLILVSVPMGLSGVLVALFVTGSSVNVQSFIGVTFVVGVAVANGILLIEFANKGLARGLKPEQAVREAARIRLRPILMTALAGSLGVLPMAIGIGHGAEANTPLGRAVVGGLLSATLLTIFVLPALFTMAKRTRSGSRVA